MTSLQTKNKCYLILTYQYERHTLPHKKLVLQRIDHGENYMKIRPTLIRHLLNMIAYSHKNGIIGLGTSICTSDTILKFSLISK